MRITNIKKLAFIVMVFGISIDWYAQNSNFGIRLEFFTYNLEKVRDLKTYTSEFEFHYLPAFYVFYSYKINDIFSVSL